MLVALVAALRSTPVQRSGALMELGIRAMRSLIEVALSREVTLTCDNAQAQMGEDGACEGTSMLARVG